MKGIEIEYVLDDENMTDQEYEDQKNKRITISKEDLEILLKYGSIPIDTNVPRTSVVDILHIKIV